MPDTIIHAADYVAGATDVRNLPAAEYAEVAFGGRSNVGKSSLINALTGRKKLVRVGATPGATRLLQFFRIVTNQGTLSFVDLPGYGYAARSKSERKHWGPLIEAYLERRDALRAVVVIVDVRRGAEPDDLELIEYLDHIGRDAIIVATKLDKLARNAQKPALEALSSALGRRILGFSSETLDGREPLWRLLFKVTGLTAPPPAPESKKR